MPKDKRPVLNATVISSIFVMLVGAMVYAGGLTSFSIVGVLLAVLNLFLAVTENMTSRRLLTEECNGLPLQICTLVNNFFGLIPTLVMAFLMGEATKAKEMGTYASWADPKVFIIL